MEHLNFSCEDTKGLLTERERCGQDQRGHSTSRRIVSTMSSRKRSSFHTRACLAGFAASAATLLSVSSAAAVPSSSNPSGGVDQKDMQKMLNWAIDKSDPDQVKSLAEEYERAGQTIEDVYGKDVVDQLFDVGTRPHFVTELAEVLKEEMAGLRPCLTGETTMRMGSVRQFTSNIFKMFYHERWGNFLAKEVLDFDAGDVSSNAPQNEENEKTPMQLHQEQHAQRWLKRWRASYDSKQKMQSLVAASSMKVQPMEASSPAATSSGVYESEDAKCFEHFSNILKVLEVAAHELSDLNVAQDADKLGIVEPLVELVGNMENPHWLDKNQGEEMEDAGTVMNMNTSTSSPVQQKVNRGANKKHVAAVSNTLQRQIATGVRLHLSEAAAFALSYMFQNNFPAMASFLDKYGDDRFLRLHEWAIRDGFVVRKQLYSVFSVLLRGGFPRVAESARKFLEHAYEQLDLKRLVEKDSASASPASQALDEENDIETVSSAAKVRLVDQFAMEALEQDEIMLSHQEEGEDTSKTPVVTRAQAQKLMTRPSAGSSVSLEKNGTTSEEKEQTEEAAAVATTNSTTANITTIILPTTTAADSLISVGEYSQADRMKEFRKIVRFLATLHEQPIFNLKSLGDYNAARKSELWNNWALPDLSDARELPRLAYVDTIKQDFLIDFINLKQAEDSTSSATSTSSTSSSNEQTSHITIVQEQLSRDTQTREVAKKLYVQLRQLRPDIFTDATVTWSDPDVVEQEELLSRNDAPTSSTADHRDEDVRENEIRVIKRREEVTANTTKSLTAAKEADQGTLSRKLSDIGKKFADTVSGMFSGAATRASEL